MFLLTTQQWALILLGICVIPIAVLIILAIIFRIKNATKKTVSVEVEKGDNEQKAIFMEAYGGEDNFVSAAIERAKVSVVVKDTELVNGERLQELGAKGVLIVGNEIRASFGERANDVYATLTSTEPVKEEAVEEESNGEVNE